MKLHTDIQRRDGISALVHHVYLHVPFCMRRKCGYCAFYSEIIRPDAPRELRPEGYAGDLLRELKRHRDCIATARTIYIGGGTPTALPPSELKALLSGLRCNLELADDAEITIEATPETITSDTAAMLAAYGVNRVSMGIQSLDPEIQSKVYRESKSSKVESAVANLRRYGIDNIGVDLIAALPGVSQGLWQDTLKSALALSPCHISVYALSFEPGSEMSQQLSEGSLHEQPVTAQLDAIEYAQRVLDREGYRRYEISNYALTGRECRHNMAIWNGADYLGIGPAAASRVGRNRWNNIPRLDLWREALNNSVDLPCESEQFAPLDDAIERVLFRLRTAGGINLEESAEQFPILSAILAQWDASLMRLSQYALTDKRDGRWMLTSKGNNVADAIMRELL